MLLLAILVGKIISLLTKSFKIGGGSAAPGYYALKFAPNLVSSLSQKIPTNIIISGTNGKTTTARMLAHFAKDQGLKVIRNNTGSNLERGIASALINHSNPYTLNPIPFDLGIWELDEAAFNSVAPKLQPKIISFLNVYRDQLDRYGEVDSVVNKWQGSLKEIANKPKIMINADDPSLNTLSDSFDGEIIRFGIKDHDFKGEKANSARITQDIAYQVSNVKLNGLEGSTFDISIPKNSIPHTLYPIPLSLPGIYHIYDFLAAFSSGIELGLDPEKMIKSLESYSSAFGRVEKIMLGQTPGYIFLIKNPAGATQVLQILSSEIKPEDKLLIVLNDNFADGTDISWIWDTEFEFLQNVIPASEPESRQTGSRVTPGMTKIVVSGTRAEDLALRLKYSGIDKDRLKVEKNQFRALELATEDLEGRLFILPTYTALLELQTILAKKGLKRRYWEE